MSQLVTRCPHCSTSFHVNEQQLRAARGAVRCGSCLQVFRADENIVFTESDPGTRRDLEALLEDDDFLIHDDIDLDDEGEPPTVPATEPEPEVKPEEKRDKPLIDEAFGDSQWQELESGAEPDADEDEDDHSDPLTAGLSDDPWADESPEPPQRREPVFSARWDEGLPTDEPPRRPQRTGQRAKTARSSEPPDFSVTPERERLISGIEPAPLEVSWRPASDHRLPSWAWTLLALLLCAALAAQLAYFRFDSLSRQEPWRGLYAAACPLLGCQLPALVDPRAIRTSNLVVRSHPQTQGALMVDAVLLNTAPFAQPFPGLLLTFTDIKNRPVASRRFTPREYLQGELAGRKKMPQGSPVHIAIEIVDPGREAVNYELHISP
ncbi:MULTISPECIES: DUF3426 domain-containing protein [unclassified Microbulbifer]|uniref:DUF3426 domain-containing protein n=1 Tax=unclassified Microbulbifer TaxID=2619833 RepID=UPI0027E4D9AF|nr:MULTISPECIES: DUF3426 domain-containing protein [unclassified Microbulbifer]